MPLKNLSVLFVDDQKTLLKAVERVIRRQKKYWQVFFADSPEKAIEILGQNPVKVIVTDMQMPEMDGVQLLQHVKSHYPNVVRFMLSGYANSERTLEAVKVAHQFFMKPFSTIELIEALELTHSLYKRVRNPGLQSLIASIDRLPTPRKVFYEISNELANPDTTIEKISEIISKDTAIAGKILQIVNSAFFGQSSRVESIKDSVNILGVETIRSLVLIAGIASDHKEILNGLISIDLYSQHCMDVATIMRWIAKKLKYSTEDQDTLFTVGLLHDIGKLILIKKYSELYLDNDWKENPYSTKLHISQIEKLGDSHAEIGAALIALWGLSPRVVNAIAFYRDIEELPSESVNFAAALHIAEGLSNYLQNGFNTKFTESDLISSTSIEMYKDHDLNSWPNELKQSLSS